MELLEALGIEPKVILVQIILFLILLFVLWRFAWGPISRFLTSRREEIKNALDQAAKVREDAETLRADYEQRMAVIEAEARAKIQEAIKGAQEMREEILRGAREDAESIVARARRAIEREKEKCLIELHDEIANLVILATRKLIRQTLDEGQQRALIDEFIQELEQRAETEKAGSENL